MSYADSQEDLWLLSHFPDDYKGNMLEVGAYDGRTASVGLLPEERGWNVLAVEPNPYMECKLRGIRKKFAMVALSNFIGKSLFWINIERPPSYSAIHPSARDDEWRPNEDALWAHKVVHVTTADALLTEYGFTSLDALAVDVEGEELNVLKGLDIDKWKPKCVIVECWDDDGGEQRKFLEAHCYKHVKREMVNDHYLRVE